MLAVHLDATLAGHFISVSSLEMHCTAVVIHPLESQLMTAVWPYACKVV